MQEYREIARLNQERAFEIIESSRIVSLWESVGAEINLVGSLKTGLLMSHKDVDFHIYSSPLSIADSFSVVAKLAENPSVVRIEYTNLIDTEEECIEWHARYKDKDSEVWQIDMIHMRKGSKYDGWFEKVADRIDTVITEKQRETVLKLKYETPADTKIQGTEYYIAVMDHGITEYADLVKWRENYTPAESYGWIP